MASISQLIDVISGGFGGIAHPNKFISIIVVLLKINETKLLKRLFRFDKLLRF